MKGEFRNSLTKYLLCLFLMLTGLFVAARFSLWSFNMLRSGHISVAIFCFGFAVGGVLFCLLSVYLFNFNKNAFLTVGNNRIDARFGRNEELHVELRNIIDAEMQGKNLKLLVNGNIVWISGLENAKELCEYILSHTVTHRFIMGIDEARKHYRKSRRSYLSYLIATITACAFLFIHIGWCVFLTEGKDLTTFSITDDLAFIAFAFAEIFTLLITYALARRAGKWLWFFNISKRHILMASATEHKCDALEDYPNPIDIKYFDHYTYRIVIFSPEDNVFAYMLEHFDPRALSWTPRYEAARGFETLTELYSDLRNTFSDAILEN